MEKVVQNAQQPAGDDVIEVVGKQAYMGNDVITKDFMGRTRQVMTFTHKDGKRHTR